MQKQAGVSAVAVVGAFALLAAAGAGFLAWQNTEQVGRLQTELDAAKSGLNKARGDLKQATQDLAAASKDAKELKLATERLTSERDQVRSALEKAQADGVNLRAELALAKEQVSYLSARSPKEVVRGMPRAPAAAK
jgi:chromosome segregation ATPase